MLARTSTSGAETMALIIETMPLTARELDVLRLLCSGKRYADIARELGMTRNTAAGHLKSVYRKLEVSSAAAAVMKRKSNSFLNDTQK